MRRCSFSLSGLVVASVLALASPAGAQIRTVPESRQEITLSFAPLVKHTAPAVVNIYTRKVVREQPVAGLFSDPLFRQFFGQELPFGMPRERVQNSLGSGVIVRSDGLIVTNHHVIKDADQITVVLSDRREFEATLVTADSRTDLALLRIDGHGERLPYLDLRDSDELEVGDLVLAIGNPFGVGQTVTSGIVSAVARTAAGVSDFNFFIQTDAAINPGNSGGALVTMDGRLAGINTAIYSRSGGSLGIGFAIPANMVRAVVAAAAQGGRIVRPWLGVNGQPVTADIAASLGLARPAGVLVASVDGGSPAVQAGLRTGDIITMVNGREIDGPEALRFRIATMAVGGRAVLTVQRGTQQREIGFTLIAPPETPPRDSTQLQGRHPLAGATVANLSPAVAEEISFEGTAKGVVVLDVAGGSPARRLGVQAKDVIVRINGQEAASVRDLAGLLRGAGQRWELTVRRGERVLTTVVGR